MKHTTQNTVEFIGHLRSIAKDKRTNAGYNGSWSDDGAGEMERNIDVWLSGLAGEIPKIFEDEYKEFQDFQDPEWHELQRLAKKFRMELK